VKDDHGIVLENSLIRANFNYKAELTSLFHKQTGKEAIEQGKVGNRFVLFEDIPFYWDAWYASQVRLNYES